MILNRTFSIFVLRLSDCIFDGRIFTLCFAVIAGRRQGFSHDCLFSILRTMKTCSCRLAYHVMLRTVKILVVVIGSAENF